MVSAVNDDLSLEEIARIKMTSGINTHLPTHLQLELQPMAMLLLYRAVIQIERQQRTISDLRYALEEATDGEQR